MDWLNGIYDSLLSLWHSQINFCLQIIFPNDFESTIEILCDIFVDVFSSLDPSITSCINEFIEKQNNPRESIQFVIEMKQFTYRFAKSIELSLTSNSSNSNKILNKPNVELLAQILYSPYREIMDNYTELEKQTLIHDLENIKAISQPSESLSKAFTYAKDVEKRCHQFTQSVAIPSLLPVLENYFKDYLQHFKSMIDDIRAKSSENDNKSSIPDWSLFQLSLFTLQASGELVVQIELFQQQLFASLIDVSK
jgi:translation elongation factor EF-G